MDWHPQQRNTWFRQSRHADLVLWLIWPLKVLRNVTASTKAWFHEARDKSCMGGPWVTGPPRHPPLSPMMVLVMGIIVKYRLGRRYLAISIFKYIITDFFFFFTRITDFFPDIYFCNLTSTKPRAKERERKLEREIQEWERKKKLSQYYFTLQPSINCGEHPV